MRIRNINHFNFIKKKYEGFFVNVSVKDGNGGNVSGFLAPSEIEFKLLSYLGMLGGESFLLIIRENKTVTYLSAEVIKRIEVDTTKKQFIV